MIPFESSQSFSRARLLLGGVLLAIFSLTIACSDPPPPEPECTLPTDCESGVCTNNECQVATCVDGVKNGSETDIDCGGPACGDATCRAPSSGTVGTRLARLTRPQRAMAMRQSQWGNAAGSRSWARFT